MSDLEPYTEQDTARDVVHVETSPLAQWANDARQAHAVASSLATTSFVPKQMQGKPHEITGAILTGAELGLSPMSSIRSINLIQGTPALSALALRGLVQSRGHELWVESSTSERVVMCGRRRGSEQVQKSTWTIDRAKRLGLTSKDNWTRQAEAMLVARATSELCRLIAADVIMGLPYSIEELADQDAEAKPKRKVKRAEPTPVAAPEIEPPTVEAEPEPAPVVVEDPDWSDVAQPGGGKS